MVIRLEDGFFGRHWGWFGCTHALHLCIYPRIVFRPSAWKDGCFEVYNQLTLVLHFVWLFSLAWLWKLCANLKVIQVICTWYWCRLFPSTLTDGGGWFYLGAVLLVAGIHAIVLFFYSQRVVSIWRIIYECCRVWVALRVLARTARGHSARRAIKGSFISLIL